MPAMTGSGPFEHSRYAHSTARLQKCTCVGSPAFLIEIDSYEKARLILKHGINTGDKRLTRWIKSRQMPTNYFISDWKKTLVLAVRTLDTRLLTDASNPLIAAGRCVTRFPGLPALEPPRINIVSSAEERTEQPDLCVRRRVLIDESRFEKHRLDYTRRWFATCSLGAALFGFAERRPVRLMPARVPGSRDTESLIRNEGVF